MTTAEEPTPRGRLDPRAVRDLVGATLIATSVITMLVLAFTISWRHGVASLALMAFAAGVMLGLD